MYGWVKQYAAAVPLLFAFSCTQPSAPSAVLVEAPVHYRTEGRVRQVDDIALERDDGYLTGVMLTFRSQCKDARGIPQEKRIDVHVSRCVDGSLDHLVGLRRGDSVYTPERFPSEMIDVCAKEIGPAQ